MISTISHQWGRGWAKQSCKKAPRKSSFSQSLLPLCPNRETMAGAGYLTPAQDLLEGMERQQLASGIRKKRHSYRQRTNTPHFSALKTFTVWVWGNQIWNSLMLNTNSGMYENHSNCFSPKTHIHAWLILLNIVIQLWIYKWIDNLLQILAIIFKCLTFMRHIRFYVKQALQSLSSSFLWALTHYRFDLNISCTYLIAAHKLHCNAEWIVITLGYKITR